MMSKDASQSRKTLVVITKCLCDPCPVFYTDTISESILIRCKDPRHSSFAGHTSHVEEEVKD